VDAPNVSGARDMGFPVRAGADGAADVSAFRTDVEQGRVRALYVFDPCQEGYIGDVAWIIEARKAGRLELLVVHGALMSALAQAADIVLPGASWVEKDGSYVNGQGRLQGAARVIAPPGEAQDDWQVFVNVGLALGAGVPYASSAAVRAEVAAAMAGPSVPPEMRERYAELASLQFARPVAARHWLQASNPSERWKWDFMFQDLPPVKFAGRPAATAIASGIQLRPAGEAEER
jgi:predicted molibdopterin-dependent oxidoreductase YjgC